MKFLKRDELWRLCLIGLKHGGHPSCPAASLPCPADTLSWWLFRCRWLLALKTLVLCKTVGAAARVIGVVVSGTFAMACLVAGAVSCEAGGFDDTTGAWKRSDRESSVPTNSSADVSRHQCQMPGQPSPGDASSVAADANRRALTQLARTFHETNRQHGRAEDSDTELIARLKVLLQRVKNERVPVKLVSATSARLIDEVMVTDAPGSVRSQIAVDETVDEVALWEREREARLKLIEKLIQERVLASKAKKQSLAEATDASQAASGQSPAAADSDLPGDGQSASMDQSASMATTAGQGTGNEDGQKLPDENNPGATASGETPDTALNTADPGDNSQQKTQSTNPLAELLQQASQTPLDGPIDRLGLGDNLFALGEFGLALQTYQQIDQSALEREDTHWVQYQVAGCLRHLDKPSEAADQYRKLAADRTAGRLAVLARWWLDRMTDRAILEADLQKFQQQIDSLKGTLNVNSSK